jgi:hypothetical protein
LWKNDKKNKSQQGCTSIDAGFALQGHSGGHCIPTRRIVSQQESMPLGGFGGGGS